jgi:hypothetical protein
MPQLARNSCSIFYSPELRQAGRQKTAHHASWSFHRHTSQQESRGVLRALVQCVPKVASCRKQYLNHGIQNHTERIGVAPTFGSNLAYNTDYPESWFYTVSPGYFRHIPIISRKLPSKILPVHHSSIVPSFRAIFWTLADTKTQLSS